MHPYARDLKILLSQHSNRRLAGPMKRHMRDQYTAADGRGQFFAAARGYTVYALK